MKYFNTAHKYKNHKSKMQNFPWLNMITVFHSKYQP
uniref:Uncharacterized protein n=2 Tax=Anguilla anguilla TaxID=7936 RepID=A0A0E9SG06_ANGAN